MVCGISRASTIQQVCCSIEDEITDTEVGISFLLLYSRCPHSIVRYGDVNCSSERIAVSLLKNVTQVISSQLIQLHFANLMQQYNYNKVQLFPLW